MESPQETPQSQLSLSPKPPERKPWPMSWVVYAILAFVVINTLVNLEFRKKEKAHEPAAEMDSRAKEHHFVNASMAGWTRLPTTIEPDAGAAPKRVEIGAAQIERHTLSDRLDREIPLELVGLIPERPSLHAAPTSISAPSILMSATLRIKLTFPTNEAGGPFGEVLAYAKENRLFVFLQDENRVAPDGKLVPPSSTMTLALRSLTFSGGDWQVTFFARGASFSWTLVSMPPRQ